MSGWIIRNICEGVFIPGEVFVLRVTVDGNEYNYSPYRQEQAYLEADIDVPYQHIAICKGRKHSQYQGMFETDQNI